MEPKPTTAETTPKPAIEVPVERKENHFSRWAEVYSLPAFILLLIGSIFLVGAFQKAQFDLGVLIDLANQTVKGIMVLILSTLTQKVAFGWRSETDKSFRSDVFDACNSAFILLFWGYLFFFR